MRAPNWNDKNCSASREISEAERQKGCLVDVPERGPKTGVVLGLAYYRSRQNRLADQPIQPVEPARSDEGPPVEMYIGELLLHHKLTQAVDIGGGAGLTWIAANSATRTKFHFVPLSTVIKPLAFVTTRRHGSAFGIRLGARLYPGDLTAADFGVTPASRFFQPGELLWSVSSYIDLATLVWPKAK